MLHVNDIMVINTVVRLLQSHSRKQSQKHMFSKYMYFYFAKYTISVDIQWILRGGLFNQLVDYEDGKGEGGSNDFFFSIYLFCIWSIYSFVRAMNNTLSRFSKSGSADDSFTQNWTRSDHSQCYGFGPCGFFLFEKI